MTPELIRTIRRIQFRTMQLAKDILAGSYRSAFKGKGMEFEEVREYTPGDDVRSIDWNVTARMNHPYVKTYREERELTVHLIIDVSTSSRFGSHETLKSQLIAEIGAVIAFSAIKNNDKLGLILFSDRIEKYLPPSNSQRQILRIIRDLLVYKPSQQGTDINKALNFLGSLQAKTGICFLISDFMSADFSHEALLTAKHHDLIAICITDPYEVVLPNLNLAELEDLETGAKGIFDLSNLTARRQFEHDAEARLDQVKHLMQKIGAGFIDIRTNQPYMPPIQKFFQLRGTRKR
jgi:uncharacterized protein (DUF58 family)